MRRDRSAGSSNWRWLLLVLAAACAGPGQNPDLNGGSGLANGDPGKTDNHPAIDVEKVCRDLHAALPHLWQVRLASVMQAGGAAERFLIREFEDAPAAPGAQATLAALGRIGGDAAVALCQQLVNERAPLAIEAALALGELPGSGSDETLLKCMADRHSDASLRAAAACSLVRHGEREHAPAFVAAIVRAGTPAGRADEKQFGLPDKSRWARERYFVQRMLRKLGHHDLCDALDSDAPWPVLEKLAPRVAARLKGE